MPAMEAAKLADDLDYFRLGLVCWYIDVVLGSPTEKINAT